MKSNLFSIFTIDMQAASKPFNAQARHITAIIYVNRGTPELNEPKVREFKYERVTDFGIVPLIYFTGEIKIESERIRTVIFNRLRNRGIDTQNIKYVEHTGTLKDLFEFHRVPWYYYANQICMYRTNINKLQDIIDKIEIPTHKVVFVSNYPALKNVHEKLLAKDLDALEMLTFLAKRIHDKIDSSVNYNYRFLEEYIRDAYELYIWHGVEIGIIRFRSIIEDIYFKSIESRLIDLLGLYWRKQFDHLYNRLCQAIGAFE